MRRAHRRRARRELSRLATAFCETYPTGGAVALARLLGPAVRVVVDTGDAPTSGDGGDPVSPAVTSGMSALSALRDVLGRAEGLTLSVRAVNGGPGVLARRDERVQAVIVLAGRVGDVTTVWVVANPDKLHAWR